MDKTKFTWIPFYQELADKVLCYKNNRTDLIEAVKTAHTMANKPLPKIENDNEVIPDIDPFTVFALFNRGKQSEDARIALCGGYKKAFGINANVPSDFDGIPMYNYNQYCFYRFVGDPKREPHCFNTLWELFEEAIEYSAGSGNKEKLANTFEKALSLSLIGLPKLTIALFQIRPYSFINLDNNNKRFITDVDNMPHYFTTIFATLNKEIPSGTTYLFMCEQAKNALKTDEYEYHSFPELSYYAYGNGNANANADESQVIDSNVKEVAYWIYSPGDNASKWGEFSESGIIGVGWDEMTVDLRSFSTKDSIKDKLKSTYDPGYSYKNAALCLWQFANEMKIGDVVFAKKGMHKIIGKGVVTSDYIYDSTRSSYRHIRKIDWQNIGEWEHPGQAVMKTLTNITPYAEYVQNLLALFAEEMPEETMEQKEITYPPYGKDEFLKEVYMSEETYTTLTELLDAKFNIILQGAPGVGKTFAAKRLAYSIMGMKDTSRVAMVQFHQSYSYEDFIQGYRPVENGFKLENGTFYKFCKAAEEDDERTYFFIIDEINRGNLSKILGELMMLIEKDKRGEKIKLLYSNEWFTVPKNVRIIGMMNTADRSLAMMDYALRRRFAFFEFASAFGSDGFKRYLAEKDNNKLNNLISVVETLNSVIAADESLGEGFRIGHSYFCTDKEITDEWLKAVVEYEVIPLLKEYWFDEPSKVRDWSANLRGAIK